VKTPIRTAMIAATIASVLAACSHEAPPAQALRPVRTAEVRYESPREVSRYFGSVQARHEVDQAFRVGGKVLQRRVDVGQSVREGDVLAELDDVDYRLSEEAAHQQLDAAMARSRQAESDWQRMQALKADGSVSDSDEEHAQSTLRTARAAAEAEARKLELARNQVKYTVLRASSSGVVTSVQFEVGQVVAAGQPVIEIANQSEPEIVADVPEDQLESFKQSRFTASLASAPDDKFEVVLRELSAQAAAQTRTYRARLKPAAPRHLPLGATATLISARALGGAQLASIPAAAITQSQGQPALWTARRAGEEQVGVVELTPVQVHGYRNDQVLVSGLPAGTVVVTAGVQKMAPGLRVALPAATQDAYLSRVAP
jgi:membrane fusion protein, multidrug efflux system